jgi:hypothetical protein
MLIEVKMGDDPVWPLTIGLLFFFVALSVVGMVKNSSDPVNRSLKLQVNLGRDLINRRLVKAFGND